MARRPCRAGYAQQLRAGIEDLCPPTRFADLAVHGNTQWTPGRLLLTLVLMSWHDAKTLVSRFENVRELLSRMLRDQPPLVLRMILLGRGKKAVFLLTDVLEPSRLSARQAREIYRRRWGIEVAYRTIKQTFDRRDVRGHTRNTSRQLVHLG